ncbi:KPN_02809 family neutral zinc metallopeptidase [Mucilaginibacter ginkgonis]|uniref:Zinc metallopeptidase n=1 Tax=Mucilaginibacter ginkgonis TaxID=2682091 RepID=A0A6I4I057_9SPHI|nr:neutral zinc metallopeptidase [Mucilaginibacter ginkgonis]QQL49731.1 zinc metallopeptidase [Mucilaginibacter ginkgonis]
MQWFGGRESDNVEEGSSSGGGRGFAFGGGILGLIGVVIYIFTGINPSGLLNGGSNNNSQQQVNAPVTGPESAEKKQARLVLAGTEEVWDSLFTARGKTYEKPILHFFTGQVDAGCGFATSATGPFYCPQDRKVYIDLDFYDELKNRFGAPGEFAQAYVIAHEVGHHVQNLLGTSQKVENAESQAGSDAERNRYSVALELQADFYAGVWAHYENLYHQNGLVLNSSDIASALNAAKQIGDDHLQQQAGGSVEPDSFTHGSSQQRMYWFKKGFDTGDLTQGNTFKEMGL